MAHLQPKQQIPGVNRTRRAKSGRHRAAVLDAQSRREALINSYEQALRNNRTEENNARKIVVSDLPIELLLQIVEHLDYLSAVRLSQTNSRFQYIAQDVFCRPEMRPAKLESLWTRVMDLNERYRATRWVLGVREANLRRPEYRICYQCYRILRRLEFAPIGKKQNCLYSICLYCDFYNLESDLVNLRRGDHLTLPSNAVVQFCELCGCTFTQHIIQIADEEPYMNNCDCTNYEPNLAAAFRYQALEEVGCSVVDGRVFLSVYVFASQF